MSSTQSVLYVEDEELLRDLVVTALQDAGFGVAVVENGAAALNALDDDAEPFCAIVTDVNLGSGPDGWAVAHRARELNDELPVVYVSGASGHEWQIKGVPCSVMISKPFTMVQLVSAVSSLLNKVRRSRRS